MPQVYLLPALQRKTLPRGWGMSPSTRKQGAEPTCTINMPKPQGVGVSCHCWWTPRSSSPQWGGREGGEPQQTLLPGGFQSSCGTKSHGSPWEQPAEWGLADTRWLKTMGREQELGFFFPCKSISIPLLAPHHCNWEVGAFLVFFFFAYWVVPKLLLGVGCESLLQDALNEVISCETTGLKSRICLEKGGSGVLLFHPSAVGHLTKMQSLSFWPWVGSLYRNIH